MVRFYFDTNVLSDIAKHPRRADFVQCLARCGDIVRVSAINVMELACTNPAPVREALLTTCNQLRGRREVLNPPYQLVRESYLAYAQGTRFNPSSHPQAEKLAIALEQPHQLQEYGGRGHHEACAFKSRSKAFLEWEHEAARGKIQAVLRKASPDERARLTASPLALSACFCESEALLRDVVESATATTRREYRLGPLPGTASEFFRRTPVWTCYFEALAWGIHARSFRTDGHGKKSNPDFADLLQFAYLPFVDTFVTSDMGLLRALSELVTNRHPGKSVWGSEEFLAYLRVAQWA